MAGKTKHPSYDELAGHVALLREQVRALKAELHRRRAETARLRGEPPAASDPAAEEPPAATARGRTNPPRWAKANVVRVQVRRPRRPRASVPGRQRAVPDRRLVPAPGHCPHCATALRRGRVVRRRQVIEVPVAPVEVVEHVVLERRCPGCGARCRADMPDLSEQVGAQRRVSWRIVALVAVLRTKLRLPIAQVQRLLRQVWGLHLSLGEVCALLDEAARAARARLGPDAEGVIVSDCYTAYGQLDGRHQRCWAHLLRDIHELKTQHPTAAGLHAWAQAMPALFTEAVAWVAAAGACPPAARERARQRFEAKVLALCRAQPAGGPHAALCQRVERSHPELFTFVADPAVPPTNNAAERALRPLVVARKISGGSRSKHGSQTRMTLQSVIAPWEVRGLDPLAELLALLRAPRTPLLELTSV